MAWTREELLSAIGWGCVRFYDPEVDGGIVNVVPIEAGVLIPRVGERVFLPGKDRRGVAYEVTEVRYMYDEPKEMRQPSQVEQVCVEIRVRRLGYRN